MRITAGTARGIQLKAPGQETRPTMDAVKEALFSRLGDRIHQARVLDLFAGSGALGLEALSRGAASAILVENDRRARGAIQTNSEKTQLHPEMIIEDVFRYLKRASGQFDLILADPPWAMRREKEGPSETERLMTSDYLPRLLAPDGILILEESRQWDPVDRWELEQARRYGNTWVHYYHLAADT